jgi:hypothetical protein
MRLLKSINKNNEEEMKKFRLIVKQHLFESLQVIYSIHFLYTIIFVFE